MTNLLLSHDQPYMVGEVSSHGQKFRGHCCAACNACDTCVYVEHAVEGAVTMEVDSGSSGSEDEVVPDVEDAASKLEDEYMKMWEQAQPGGAWADKLPKKSWKKTRKVIDHLSAPCRQKTCKTCIHLPISSPA